ncbi:MAG: YifB family Mg chelatase-like AAA ATPase [Patescibacteria group bacterium]|nr:YifB family Mg chelatase-like AAA ATPase [bacterium]MDZ4241069.1 YifB family Mg chelatase-like AAA ATPase [Patescibacteria group bacterium]
MFGKVYSAQLSFLSAHIVHIEVDLSRGLYSFSIVGLPDKAVEEARDRISAAIKNSGFKSPKNKNQKVVISLAPAELKKEGSLFDLPMALAYLLASEDVSFSPEKRLFLGELSLDGTLRKIQGALPLVEKAKREGFTEVFLPKDNAREAAFVRNIKIFGVRNLKEVAEHLEEKKEKQKKFLIEPQKETAIVFENAPQKITFGDIKGQEGAKRGLEIAAAGGHNIAMYGPPGTGKTMLAKAFCGILPPLSREDIFEVTSIHSATGILKDDLLIHPPFRAPHHTSSYVSLIGGGTIPKPGEVTLAHNGVLFLDEFPEFESRVIDSLREPLEERVARVSRARGSVQFPAKFILIAAMNPCPCGYFGVKGKSCVCRPADILRYKRKISGPIIDRIDLWVEVANIGHEKLMEKGEGVDYGETARKRVLHAREIQEKRFKSLNLQLKTNSELGPRSIVNHISLDTSVKKVLDDAARRFDLSPRMYHRIIKVARTIADLEPSENIKEEHLFEALQYRPKQEERG